VAEGQLGVGEGDQGHGIAGKACEGITAATAQQGIRRIRRAWL
jgi:hypothetical protein